jgi:hypothetical protein
MRGPSSRIRIRGFSTKRECAKHTYEAHNDKIKVENIITSLFKELQDKEAEGTSKDRTCLQKHGIQYDQWHSPRPRGEDLLRQFYAHNGL